jgi:AcrR family transcriptional regulator
VGALTANDEPRSAVAEAPAPELNHSDGRVRRSLAAAYAIERAALALFVERGYDETTAEDIATAAGVSVRTFFRHFPTGKQGVIVLETRRTVDALRAALEARPPQEPALVALREAGRDVIRAEIDRQHDEEAASTVYDDIAARHPELIALMLGERHMRMESLVQPIALRMSLDPVTDMRPRLLINAFNAAWVTGWSMRVSNRALDVVAFIEAGLDTLENGLLTSMSVTPDYPPPLHQPQQ